MAMDSLLDSDSTAADEQEAAGAEGQNKSLVANVYNNNGQADPDPYKELDWQMPSAIDELDVSEAMLLSYYFVAPRSAGSAVVQNTLDDYSTGGHEEWYAELQLKLAHIFGDVGIRIPEFEEREIEPRGATPMLDFLGIDGDDIVQYLQDAHVGEVDTDIDPEQVASRLVGGTEEETEESEPQEADD